jgi:hypothetical protein
MPSRKVSMRSSLTNKTSIFGIMGGLYNRKISGRSSMNRVTSRLVIPASAAAGYKYMKMHNLLSRNPLGSGGVGRMFHLRAGGSSLGKSSLRGNGNNNIQDENLTRRHHLFCDEMEKDKYTLKDLHAILGNASSTLTDCVNACRNQPKAGACMHLGDTLCVFSTGGTIEPHQPAYGSPWGAQCKTGTPTYSCNKDIGKCEVDTTSTMSKKECDSVECSMNLYTCNKEQEMCVVDISGTMNKDECNNIGCNTFYTCDNDLGKCSKDPDSTMSKAECTSAGCIKNSYTCDAVYGTCKLSSKGESKDDCDSSCNMLVCPSGTAWDLGHGGNIPVKGYYRGEFSTTAGTPHPRGDAWVPKVRGCVQHPDPSPGWGPTRFYDTKEQCEYHGEGVCGCEEGVLCPRNGCMHTQPGQKPLSTKIDCYDVISANIFNETEFCAWGAASFDKCFSCIGWPFPGCHAWAPSHHFRCKTQAYADELKIMNCPDFHEAYPKYAADDKCYWHDTYPGKVDDTSCF